MTPTKKMSQEDKAIVESYLTACFLITLIENKFETSSHFDKLEFSNPSIKGAIKKMTLMNSGILMSILHCLLVVPRSLVRREFEEEFQLLNDKLLSEVTIIKRYDESSIDLLYHIRNSVAHARFTVSHDGYNFQDKKRAKKKTKHFECFVPNHVINIVIGDLQEIFIAFYKRRTKS